MILEYIGGPYDGDTEDLDFEALGVAEGRAFTESFELWNFIHTYSTIAPYYAGYQQMESYYQGANHKQRPVSKKLKKYFGG